MSLRRGKYINRDATWEVHHELVLRPINSAPELVAPKVQYFLDSQGSYLSVELVNASNIPGDAEDLDVPDIGLPTPYTTGYCDPFAGSLQTNL